MICLLPCNVGIKNEKMIWNYEKMLGYELISLRFVILDLAVLDHKFKEQNSLYFMTKLKLKMYQTQSGQESVGN